MTKQQYRIFNKVVINRPNNKLTIDFENSTIKNVDFNKLENFKSIKTKTNYEDFYKEFRKKTVNGSSGLYNAKEYYIENVAFIKYQLFNSFYRNHPEEFEKFYNWIIDELLPQYQIYNNDK